MILGTCSICGGTYDVEKTDPEQIVELKAEVERIKVRPELPDWVFQQLLEHKWSCTDSVSVFHYLCIDKDCWAGVIGDGDNASYEWFLINAEFRASDCGYGDSLVAYRDVLKRATGDWSNADT